MHRLQPAITARLSGLGRAPCSPWGWGSVLVCAGVPACRAGTLRSGADEEESYLLAVRPSRGRYVEILTRPRPGPSWFLFLYWRVSEGLPFWEFPAVESLPRCSGVCARRVPAAWRGEVWGALRSRCLPHRHEAPWAPGGSVLEARQRRRQSPGLWAQHCLFLCVCLVSLTAPGEAGAPCPVPAPDLPSCFCSSVAGQDSGKVVIWNMSPVLQEDDEKDENVPKMLCQMDNHLGITGWPFAGFACWHSAQG